MDNIIQGKSCYCKGCIVICGLECMLVLAIMRVHCNDHVRVNIVHRYLFE